MSPVMGIDSVIEHYSHPNVTSDGDVMSSVMGLQIMGLMVKVQYTNGINIIINRCENMKYHRWWGKIL